jgi:hypothetical protein
MFVATKGNRVVPIAAFIGSAAIVRAGIFDPLLANHPVTFDTQLIDP